MKKIVILVLALFSVSVLSAKGDLHIFNVNNKDASITTKQIEKAFVDNGFGIGINSNMNKPFMIQFKKTSFKIYTLLTVYDKELSFELVKKHPMAGVFTPMGVGIYQRKNEDTLHVAILTSEAQAKILGFDDPLLKTIETKILDILSKALPTAKHTINKDSLSESVPLVTKYELELDGEDKDESFENVIMSIENDFELFGFIVPSKLNVKDMIKGDNPYDFYKTYSICKLPVIYTVSQSRPEAGSFAPCSLMIYKKKNEDKIVLGFPNVHNWMSSAQVENKEAKAILLKAQKQFEAILAEAVE